MTIQRYSGDNVEFHATGDLVAYEDYAELKEEYERLDKSHSAALAKIDALAAENALFKQDYMKIPALRARGWPKTPATDACAASLRAEGVDMYAHHLKDKYEGIEYSLIGEYYTDGEEDRISDQGEIECARAFAAQLRSKSEVQS